MVISQAVPKKAQLSSWVCAERRTVATVVDDGGWLLKPSASAYSAPISVHTPLPSPSVASNSKHASCRSARCDPSTRRTVLGLVASSGGTVVDCSARRGLDGSASGER